MFRWIVGSSLKFRFLVVAIAAGMVAFGVDQFRGMPVDVFPEFAPPRVEIQTPALGLSTAEVEELVTIPLEQAFNGLPGLVVMSESDGDVEMRLLRYVLAWPLRSLVVVDALEVQRSAVAPGAGPAAVVVDLGLPSEELCVEGGQSRRVGTVDDPLRVACDSHAVDVTSGSGRSASACGDVVSEK